jgi:hypothetical protein
MKKPVVKKIKTFSIEVHEFSDGNDNIFVRSKGFNGFELIGILTTFRDEQIIKKLTDLEAAKTDSEITIKPNNQ